MTVRFGSIADAHEHRLIIAEAKGSGEILIELRAFRSTIIFSNKINEAGVL